LPLDEESIKKEYGYMKKYFTTMKEYKMATCCRYLLSFVNKLIWLVTFIVIVFYVNLWLYSMDWDITGNYEISEAEYEE